MDVAEVVELLGGVASTRQLLRHVSSRQVHEAVDARRIVRVARGAYALPTAEDAAVAAARLTGTVACLSAAQAAGWELARTPDRPWIAVPRHRSRVDDRGVHLLFSDERETRPVRIVVQCARHLPLPEALAVADSALRSGQVDADELLRAAAAVRGRGATACRRVAAAASPLKASALESALHGLALDVPGLRLVPQVAIDLGGVTVHPDLVDEERRLVVEAEGWLYHGSSPEAFDRDVWRYTMLVVAGWRVVRFTHRQVIRQPAYVLETLTALLRTGNGHRPVA